MINALGDAIEDGDINCDDINIVLFDKGEDRKFTNISFSKFDDNGDLINWPIGFFRVDKMLIEIINYKEGDILNDRKVSALDNILRS
ncbi:TPA: hypothetical protein ACGGS8_003766, partial [Vibrio cholerae]